MFEDVRDLYNAAILERGRRPRHMGKLEAFDTTAKGDNPMCGDRVTVWLKFAPDGTIGQTGFDARGCEISKASADLMVEDQPGFAGGLGAGDGSGDGDVFVKRGEGGCDVGVF